MAIKKLKHRGRFIVLEGVDGAGTTSQARSVVEWLPRGRRERVTVRTGVSGP